VTAAHINPLPGRPTGPARSVRNIKPENVLDLLPASYAHLSPNSHKTKKQRMHPTAGRSQGRNIHGTKFIAQLLGGVSSNRPRSGRNRSRKISERAIGHYRQDRQEVQLPMNKETVASPTSMAIIDGVKDTVRPLSCGTANRSD
jgi:hypothetical protein